MYQYYTAQLHHTSLFQPLYFHANQDLIRDLTADVNAAVGLPTAAAAAWRRAHETMRRASENIAAAGDLAASRIAFQPLSDALWQLLRDFDHADEDPVRLFHCPMAFDNTGANWIQSDKTTANPYYGATMLRCGFEKAQLSPTAEGAK